MFREMRRRQQTLTQEECKEILHRGTSGYWLYPAMKDTPMPCP